jgi:hypothetical protein
MVMLEWILDNLAIAFGGLVVATIVAAWFFIWTRTRIKKPATYEPDTVACPPPPPQQPYEIPGFPRTVEPSEKVEFAVFAPAGVHPNSAFVLNVWAYLRDQYPVVKEIAKEVGMKVLGRKAAYR